MRWLFFLPLTVLIPFLGGPNRRYVIWGLTGLAWCLFSAAFLLKSDGLEVWIIYSQVPALALVTVYVFVYLSIRRDLEARKKDMSEGSDLLSLKERHESLRKTIVEVEKKENQSLQIYAIAKSLAEAISWKDMAPRLTSGIQKIFGAYEFLLYAMDENGSLVLVHRRGGWVKEPPVEKSWGDKVRIYKPPETSEVIPVVGIPVFSSSSQGRHISGALFFKPALEGKSEEELCEIGEEFGEQLNMSLHKALLFNQMEMNSKYDGLTGVFRRQIFMDRLEEELKKAKVFHSSLSLMMIDVDHFKSINDQHGHAAGDAVLVKIGELLRQGVYETDAVGRFGGEEFIVLMPKADPVGVSRKAEALRQKIAQEIIYSGFEKLSVTVSIGISHFPRHASLAQDLVDKADKALYLAKDRGRNLVIEAE